MACPRRAQARRAAAAWPAQKPWINGTETAALVTQLGEAAAWLDAEAAKQARLAPTKLTGLDRCH